MKVCQRCFIILSNSRVCNCGHKHGAFSPRHPDFCKRCWNEHKGELKEQDKLFRKIELERMEKEIHEGAEEDEFFAEQADKAQRNALEEAQRTDGW